MSCPRARHAGWPFRISASYWHGIFAGLSAPTSQNAVSAPRAPVPNTLASDLSGYHQIQLGFISVRDHFEPQWFKESLELLSGGKWLKKQIAGGS